MSDEEYKIYQLLSAELDRQIDAGNHPVSTGPLSPGTDYSYLLADPINFYNRYGIALPGSMGSLPTGGSYIPSPYQGSSSLGGGSVPVTINATDPTPNQVTTAMVQGLQQKGIRVR